MSETIIILSWTAALLNVALCISFYRQRRAAEQLEQRWRDILKRQP